MHCFTPQHAFCYLHGAVDISPGLTSVLLAIVFSCWCNHFLGKNHLKTQKTCIPPPLHCSTSASPPLLCSFFAAIHLQSAQQTVCDCFLLFLHCLWTLFWMFFRRFGSPSLFEGALLSSLCLPFFLCCGNLSHAPRLHSQLDLMTSQNTPFLLFYAAVTLSKHRNCFKLFNPCLLHCMFIELCSLCNPFTHVLWNSWFLPWTSYILLTSTYSPPWQKMFLLLKPIFASFLLLGVGVTGAKCVKNHLRINSHETTCHKIKN